MAVLDLEDLALDQIALIQICKIVSFIALVVVDVFRCEADYLVLVLARIEQNVLVVEVEWIDSTIVHFLKARNFIREVGVGDPRSVHFPEWIEHTRTIPALSQFVLPQLTVYQIKAIVSIDEACEEVIKSLLLLVCCFAK